MEPFYRLLRPTKYEMTYLMFFILVLFFGLFHTALYFNPAKTYVSTFIIGCGMLATIWLFLRRKFHFSGWVLVGYCYAGYTLLSTCWAANPELSVEGALVVTAGVTLAAWIPLVSERVKLWIMTIIACTGSVLFWFSCAVRFKLFVYLYAFQTDSVDSNMMDSVFQYHNAFGAFELAALLMTILLVTLVKKRWQSFGLLLNGAICFLGVTLSYSRWSWILTVAMVFLLLAGSLWVKRFQKVFLVLCCVMIPALVAFYWAMLAIRRPDAGDFWMSEILLVLGALVGAFFLLQTERMSEKGLRATLWLLAGMILIGCLLFVKFGKLPVGSLVNTVHTVQVGSQSLQFRLLFYKAAMSMWKENPLFGSGAGTWASKFEAFQQFPYYSTKVHSYFFDQLLNGGVIGVILWMTFIVLGVRQCVQAIRRTDRNPIMHLAALLAALTLFLHSMFDFDMDYPVILFLLFLLLGFGAPHFVEPKKSVKEFPSWIKTMPIVLLCLLLTILGIGLAISQVTVQQAMNTKNVPERIQLLQRATSYAPYDAKTQMELAIQEEKYYLTTHQTSDRIQLWQNVQAAEQTATWDPTIQLDASEIAYRLGYGSETVEWGQASYRDGRFLPKNADTILRLTFWTGVHEYGTDRQEAHQTFQTVLDTYQRIETDIQHIKTLPQKDWSEWRFEKEAPMQVYAAAADLVLGQYAQSLHELPSLSSGKIDAESTRLTQVVSLLDKQRLGKSLSSKEKLNMEKMLRNPTWAQDYKILASLH